MLVTVGEKSQKILSSVALFCFQKIMSASVWGTLIPIAFAIFVAFVGYRTYSCLYDIPPLPELKETWWGPGDAKSAKLDTTIKPFKISVPDEVSLKSIKLNRTRVPSVYRSSPYGY